MRGVGKITDGFQTQHRGNLVAALFAAMRVNETSHLFGLEIGHFFIHEGNEAQGLPGGFSREAASEREQGCDPAAVIVRAGRAEDRIVMRTDENDLRTSAG